MKFREACRVLSRVSIATVIGMSAAVAADATPVGARTIHAASDAAAAGAGRAASGAWPGSTYGCSATECVTDS